VFDPATNKIIAGARTPDGRALVNTMASILGGESLPPLLGGTATTLGVVATDAALTKAQTAKVAQMAHDGLARTINPIHTAYDGDTIFALSTAKNVKDAKEANVTLIGALAAEAVARAVVRAVRAARGVAGFPSAAEMR
jgi:L-aminopeptidase/D-esterase-like protein